MYGWVCLTVLAINSFIAMGLTMSSGPGTALAYIGGIWAGFISLTVIAYHWSGERRRRAATPPAPPHPPHEEG